jgi:hypothetical protein
MASEYENAVQKRELFNHFGNRVNVHIFTSWSLSSQRESTMNGLWVERVRRVYTFGPCGGGKIMLCLSCLFFFGG